MKNLGLVLSWIVVLTLLSCSDPEIVPNEPADTGTTPPTTGTPPPTTTPPATTPPPATNPPPATTPPPAAARPGFLPKFFNEKSTCLLNKVFVEATAAGRTTKTTNVYTYDQYNRFTEIKSTTEGVAGEAVWSYTYKDSEKQIEVKYTGFSSEDNFKALALLNDDYLIHEIQLTSSSETSKTTFTYNADGELSSQKFDSNLKSYDVEYTYSTKGIVKSERKNYRFKASPAPEREDLVLEWVYGDVSSEGYTTLVLSDPNFPIGYLGKSFATLPSQNTLKSTTRITNPITFEFSTNSTTNYAYTKNAQNKVVRIDTDTNTAANGVSVQAKTKVEIEYK